MAPTTDRTGASRYGPRSVSSTLLVLQQIACEPPGAFEHELRSPALDLRRVELDQGERLPDWRAFAATIVMGGPMAAYEEEVHPRLVEEKRHIRDAAQAGHPIWGVCLGAQLLAGALGARVYQGEEAEVGLLPVEFTAAADEDPCSPTRRAGFPTLPWHGDSFHLEVTPELAAEWGDVPAYAQSLERIQGPGALERLVDEVGAHAGTTIPLAHGLFGRWLERVARVPAQAIG
jgi:GMP synthase (glutamine-hydrolysing)